MSTNNRPFEAMISPDIEILSIGDAVSGDNVAEHRILEGLTKLGGKAVQEQIMKECGYKSHSEVNVALRRLIGKGRVVRNMRLITMRQYGKLVTRSRYLYTLAPQVINNKKPKAKSK